VPADVRHADLDRPRTITVVRWPVVGNPTVALDRTDSPHEHRRARHQPAEAADDVDELLHAHIRAESALGHHVVSELHRDQVRDEGVVSMIDVREGAAIHDARLPLERLDQVRLQRVTEQHGHGTSGAEVLCGHRAAAVVPVRHRDRPQPATQLLQVAGDCHHRHHLRGGGDIEPRLARVAVRASAQADHDSAQRAVVHVERAAPVDSQRIDR